MGFSVLEVSLIHVAVGMALLCGSSVVTVLTPKTLRRVGFGLVRHRDGRAVLRCGAALWPGQYRYQRLPRRNVPDCIRDGCLPCWRSSTLWARRSFSRCVGAVAAFFLVRVLVAASASCSGRWFMWRSARRLGRSHPRPSGNRRNRPHLSRKRRGEMMSELEALSVAVAEAIPASDARGNEEFRRLC